MLIRNPIQNLSFRIPGGFAQYMKIPRRHDSVGFDPAYTRSSYG
jgi:hypothetical protein